MSYDVYLRAPKCPTCGNKGPEPDCPDPTYNLTPIFDLALTGEGLPNPGVSEAAVVLFREKTDRPRGLRVLDGKTGRESIAMINTAIDRLCDAKLTVTFIALEPENKWGTLKDARDVMKMLKERAEEYPDNTWDVR